MTKQVAVEQLNTAFKMLKEINKGTDNSIEKIMDIEMLEMVISTILEGHFEEMEEKSKGSEHYVFRVGGKFSENWIKTVDAKGIKTTRRVDEALTFYRKVDTAKAVFKYLESFDFGTDISLEMVKGNTSEEL